MVELPFEDNPFASKATPSSQANVDKAHAISVPPAPKAPPQNTQRQKKITNQVTINDAGRGEASMRGKMIASKTPYAASLIIWDLAKDNFKDEDVICWSKRGKVEAKFCFKQARGESFFHGLDLVNSLEGKNLKHRESFTNAKTSSNYYKGLLDGAEKKIEDLNDGHKSKLKSLQDELDRVKGEVRTVVEGHKKEFEKLKSEKENI